MVLEYLTLIRPRETAQGMYPGVAGGRVSCDLRIGPGPEPAPSDYEETEMPGWPDKLRLKALAEEDIYFAKRDRELIKALHERRLAKLLKVDAKKAKKKAKTLQNAYADATLSHKDKPKRLAKYYRGLIKKALRLVTRKRH
jgi:hypothetical protein